MHLRVDNTKSAINTYPSKRANKRCGLVALTIAANYFNCLKMDPSFNAGDDGHDDAASTNFKTGSMLLSSSDRVRDHNQDPKSKLQPCTSPPPPPPPPPPAPPTQSSKPNGATTTPTLYSETLETLLSTAQSLRYTWKGEIFSAEWLAELARRQYSLHASVVEWKPSKPIGTNQQEQDLIKECLSKGGLCLVAYDKDGNNEPCLKGGSKAHWAVINGFAYRGKATIGDGDDSSSKRPEFLLCFHGKSLHQAVWSYESLQTSCWNLARVNDVVLGMSVSNFFRKHWNDMGRDNESLVDAPAINEEDDDDYLVDAMSVTATAAAVKSTGRDGYILPNSDGILTESLAGKLVLIYSMDQAHFSNGIL
ncbi:hypothetical protein BDR26DRAFT_915951 [Obelidium mucronatum]|nr:hypothetical protein BDR26DRAFT_915951 [Obelidium mucronatum]